MLVYSGLYGKLPLFPPVYAPITEDRVERMAERMMDIGDAIFLRGDATQEQYDAWVAKLNKYVGELLAQA